MFFAFLYLSSCFYFGNDSIKLYISPQPLYIETDKQQQLVNADLIIENNSADTLEITQILLVIKDDRGKLVMRKFLNWNGVAPGILTIPERLIFPGKKRVVFNPFYSFSTSMPLDTLIYQVTVAKKDGSILKIQEEISPLKQKFISLLSLPVKQRFIVDDGHDFYSHHRRLDPYHELISQYGLAGNFNRYAYDICIIDEQGNMFPSGANPDDMKQWYGFGKPIYASATGKVIAVNDTCADDRSFDLEHLRIPLALYGNYIAIRHQDGRIAIYGHIENKSAQVRLGQHIQEGQLIARIGASGASIMPHLHFELRNSLELNSEGVPSYFKHITRVYGHKKIREKQGRIDTGDIILPQ